MVLILGDNAALRVPKEPAPLKFASQEAVFEVEQFLFREVRLLEDEHYEEWLGTMTEDIHYWMPGVQARYRKDKAPRYSHTRMAHFDDDLLNLRRRVTRFMDDTAWAEDPRTRTCYMVSNIQVELVQDTDEYIAHSVILNIRGRNEVEEDWLMARRKDRLRKIGDGSLRLARREIYITESVLLAKNLNVFL